MQSEFNVGAAWDRYAEAYQKAARLPTDVVSYGPGLGTEANYRLLGPLAGKRVLDLGCGGGQSSIAFARAGAISIGVDISAEQLAFARHLVEQEEVRVEFKQGDLAELAFQRADSVDLVFSAFAFQYVPDIHRVFRQVHRVLKPHGTLVFSLPHPASVVTGQPTTVIDPTAQLTLTSEPDTPTASRSYFDRSPTLDRYEEVTFAEYHRTISDIYTGLARTGYRVDVLLEPDTGSVLPTALIVRARKES